MRARSLPAVLLALSWMLGACRDDSPTQPTSPSDRVPTEPQLAVASNTWITRANMWGAERWDLAATSLTNTAGQSILYAIGGRSAAGGPLGKVMAYNVVTNTWTERAALPVPLWGTSGATVLNGKIYVAGGCWAVDCSFSGPSNRLYVYDLATNIWTRKRDMPYQNEDDGFPAGGGVSGVIGGRLYVVSQCWYVPQSDFWFDNCVPSFFSRYNPATDRWTSLPRPSGSYYRVGGVINGKFYVAGKFYDPSTDQQKPRVEVYDPATNRWTRMTPPTTLGDYGAVMLGKLYTISGRQLRIYNPVTNTVTTRASLPTDRGIVAAAKVFLNGQPRLEVVGGTRPGNNLQYTP